MNLDFVGPLLPFVEHGPKVGVRKVNKKAKAKARAHRKRVKSQKKHAA